jgi:hypothetical protein
VGLLIRSLTDDFRRFGLSVTANLNFVFTVETTVDGETFTVPTVNGASYNCNAAWDDASDDDITTYNDAAWTHTYATAGTYTIVISGTFGQIKFNNTGDKLKIKDISNLGVVGWESMANAFFGCNNLILLYTDGESLPDNIDVTGIFRNCFVATTVPIINTTGSTNLFVSFSNMGDITSFPLIDTSSVTSMYLTWSVCSSLTSFPAVDLGSCIDFRSTWNTCAALTTFPANMFDNCGSMPWYALINTFFACALDQTSVDGILVSWRASGSSGVTADIDGGTNAAPSAVGDAAVVDLVADGWTVTTN